MPRVAEAIIGCLLALHNNPSTRSLCNFRLGVVVAPFTEFRYVHSSHTLSGGGGGNTATATADQEEREFRFQSSETAILCLVRSWTGLMLLIEPDKNGVSHLQALTDILYLDNFKVRVSAMECTSTVHWFVKADEFLMYVAETSYLPFVRNGQPESPKESQIFRGGSKGVGSLLFQRAVEAGRRLCC